MTGRRGGYSGVGFCPIKREGFGVAEFALDTDVDSLLNRLDTSSSQKLLVSLASELLRVGRAHAALAARVSAMEVLQTTIDQILATESEAESTIFPHKVVIEAASSLQNASGLFPLEHDSLGRAFRWTGPDTNFSFQLFFDRRTAAHFCLQFGAHVTRLPPEWMRCFVDGNEIVSVIARVPEGYELRGKIPARRYQGGTLLMFICPASAPSGENNPDGDPRLLGVSFQTLSIESIGADNQPGSNVSSLNSETQVEVLELYRQR
jgi:hypothetical protein